MSQTSFSPNTEVLRKLAAFVLNRESNDFRSELYEYLVMTALNIHGDGNSKGIKKKPIISSIEKDLGVVNFPAVLVSEALDRLESKGWVKKVREREDPLYFLSQDEKTKLELIENRYTQTIAQVSKTLNGKMTEKGLTVDLSNEGQIFSIFRTFLSLVLSDLGKECCFDLIRSRGKTLGSFEPLNIAEALRVSLKSVTEPKKQKTFEEVFADYFINPDEPLSARERSTHLRWCLNNNKI